MKIISKVTLIITVLFLSLGYCGWKEEKESLEKILKTGEFRIFYSLEGKHALPLKHQIDSNNNNIPDYVEDIAIQLNTSIQLFEDLGFEHPLKNKRYLSQGVQYIDVHILSSKSGGGAGDAIIQYNYQRENEPAKALAINLSNNLKYHSLTPHHEVFHLIQNGYTMFKNKWYEEGTARWSECVLAQGVGKDKMLPQNVDELTKNLLNKKYSSSFVWNRLSKLCDSSNKHFVVAIKLLNRRYVDNTKVIQDNMMHGLHFMLSYLQELRRTDKLASLNQNYNKYDWKEKEQRKRINNNYMLCALKRTIVTQCNYNSDEILNFIQSIDNYTKNSCIY